MPRYAVGQSVLYLGSWGNDDPEPCTITDVGEKNGRTVYGNSLCHWGYEDQYETAR